jgi:hypothetical protein
MLYFEFEIEKFAQPKSPEIDQIGDMSLQIPATPAH